MNKCKNKKIVLTLAALSISLSVTGVIPVQKAHATYTPTPVFKSQGKIVFQDVKIEWQKDAVLWAVENGLVEGYPDGTFKPDNHITEAEFVTMLIKFAGNIDHERVEPETSRILNNHWSSAFYKALNKHGVSFPGYTHSRLKDEPINRGLMAQIIAAKNGFNLSLKQSVEYMYENNFSNGMDSSKKSYDTYGVDIAVTRAQAVTFLKRISEKDITTFKGISSAVKGDEIKGIIDGGIVVEEQGKPSRDFHRIAKSIAEKNKFTTDGIHSSVRIINDDGAIVASYNMLGWHRSTKEYINIALEMIQKIEKVSDKDMDIIKKALNESIIDSSMKFVQIRGSRIQISGSSFKEEISIKFPESI